MRRSIFFALAATLLGVVFVTWLEPNHTEVISARSNLQAVAPAPERLAANPLLESSLGARDWQTNESPSLRPVLPPALRDIFAPEVPPPAPTLSSPEMGTQPAEDPAPAPNVRFLGSFVTPSGQQILYLSQGEQETEAKIGEVLLNGYVVESATAEAVHLVYPRLGTKVIVPATSE